MNEQKEAEKNEKLGEKTTDVIERRKFVDIDDGVCVTVQTLYGDIDITTDGKKAFKVTHEKELDVDVDVM